MRVSGPFMKRTLNKDSDRGHCCSALKACKDQTTDGRKAVDSVLGAFVASRFGKTAIRAASALIESMTKDALVTDKFKDILVALSSVATTSGQLNIMCPLFLLGNIFLVFFLF